MSNFENFLYDRKVYPLSEYMFSESEAFYNGVSEESCDISFLKLVARFQEETPYHAGIATKQKIIAYAFAKGISADETDNILQTYHFTALYPKSLFDSSIIFALNTKMSAGEWTVLYKKYERLLKRNNQNSKSAIFGRRLEKREFFSYLAASKSLVDSGAKSRMVSELLLIAEKTKENVDKKALSEVLDAFYDGKIKVSKTVKSIKDETGLNSEMIYYIMAKNASFDGTEDVENLYAKLKKTSSSLLSFSKVQSEINETDPCCVFEHLKPYFEEKFSFEDLYDMLQLFSEESPYATDSFGMTIDTTNQEISQWLMQAVEKRNYDLFFANAGTSLESLRYKKRRYIFKYLYYFVQENIDRFYDFEQKLIKRMYKCNDLKKLKKEYLSLADSTLIKGLSKICVRKESDNGYNLESLTENHNIGVDMLSKMDITFSSLFFDFCSFWGNYNLVGRAFINKFEVFVFYNEVPIEQAEENHALVTVVRGKDMLPIAFNIKEFRKEYQMFDETEETVKDVFLKKLSENIKGWDSISSDSIQWLLSKSSVDPWEEIIDSLLNDDSTNNKNDTLIEGEENDFPKHHRSPVKDNRYMHDYKIFKNIITGKTDASRDFLLLFAVYCGADLDEIEEHLLVNVGYLGLDEERPFDQLIIALAKEPVRESRKLRFFDIIYKLDWAYENNKISLYFLQKEILNAICTENHEFMIND